jgi:hypothetical protein
MRGHLDGTDLFNALMLLQSREPQPTLVVEGESDYNLAIDFFPKDQLEIVVGYGKKSLLEAGALAESVTQHVRFLVDADFDHITGESANYSSNVVATEYYDLYMDIHFATDATLRRVARRYLKDASFSEDEVLSMAWSVAELIGRLRYVSVTRSYHLNLESYPSHTLVPASPSTPLDESALISLTITRSNNTSIDESELRAELEKAQSEVDAPQVVNSHDLLRALSGTCRAHGKAKLGHNFEDLFELAVDAEVFAKLKCASSISSWIESYSSAAA